MKIAISTSSLADNTREALDRAADLGFKVVEINITNREFSYGYQRKPDAGFFRILKKHLDQRDLTPWSVTTPPLTQEQMFAERARKEILMGSAGAAGILGAKVLVVQPADIFRDQGSFDSYMRDHKAPPVTEGFDETWVQTVNRKIAMALVNRDYWIGTPLTNQVDRLTSITTDLAISCALDIRQALIRNDFTTWLDQVGERLVVAYAYDLEENRRSLAPLDPLWEEWCTRLKASRLKCLVIRTDPGQDDQQIVRSRRFLERWLF